MTSRERMIRALDYRQPDRIPLIYHHSPAGQYVHGQKLIDLFNKYPSDTPIEFGAPVAPLPETVDALGRYHETKTDEWGTRWEYLIFGVWGHPKAFPFPDWQAAHDYKFPAAATTGSPDFVNTQKWVAEQKKKFFMIGGGASLLEKLCALRPMDEILVDLYDRNPDLLAFLDRLTEYMMQMQEYSLALGHDAIQIADDWGTQTSQVVAPDLFREIYLPRYRKLAAQVKRAGARLFFHSCGCLGPIFDDLIDLGVTCLWPQIRYVDNEETARKFKDRGVSIYLHPDRQHLVPRGTPAEIDAEIRRLAERHHKLGGGAMFWVEIENDAPFENVKALIESVDRYR